MIISRTPYRVSFFGGGTDYPEWFESNGGAVVASAINKYAYIICQRTPRFVDYRYRISYRNTEIVSNIDEIQHPAVREAIRLLGIPYGIELNHHGDLLARSGVGSSSAFAVGLLNVLHHLGARRMSPAGLAREAIELEHDILHETVGCQDQFTCALGGLNYLEFGPQRSVSVRPITPGPEVLDEIDERMVIVYSGEQRISSVVAEPLIGNVKSQEKLFNAT
ncbi:MAG TPA: hypothetical protein VMU77_06360, partial [Acidimicrobiales bacterium]|nr:hypothetical protein [Acidimicrobiales bacterium]